MEILVGNPQPGGFSPPTHQPKGTAVAQFQEAAMNLIAFNCPRRKGVPTRKGFLFKGDNEQRPMETQSQVHSK